MPDKYGLPDDFVDPTVSKSSGLGIGDSNSGMLHRTVGDVGVGLLRGTFVGIPETAVGLADIPTMGYAGKVVESVGKGIGIGGFKEGNEFFNKLLSPETQEAQRKVSEAEGFVDTIKTAVQNPSAIMQVVSESIPAMITGTRLAGLGMKGVGYGLKELGITEAQQKARQIVAGAIGEAAVTAGANIEDVRQQTEDKLLTPMQAGIGVASAAVTGVLGVLGGKLADRLGITDFNTLLAGGTGNKKQLLKSLLYGAFQEGAIEELPQSMQEQIAQNISLGKPIGDDVFEQGAIGLLAGIAQSTGAQLAGGMMQKMRAEDVNQKNIDTQITQLDPDVQEAIGGLDGNVTGADINIESKIAEAVDAENMAIENVEIAKEQERVKANNSIAEEADRLGVKYTGSYDIPGREPVLSFFDPQTNGNFGVGKDETLEQAILRHRDSFKNEIVKETPEEKQVTVKTVSPETIPTSPVAVQKDIRNLLSKKSDSELGRLYERQPDSAIGKSAGAILDERIQVRKEREAESKKAVVPVASPSDIEAQAASEGIQIEPFKQHTPEALNQWAEMGVRGAQLELERRVAEGILQPNQLSWKQKEANTQQPSEINPAKRTKIPKAAAFGRELKVKDEYSSRIADAAERYKGLISRAPVEEQSKRSKAIGMQMSAIKRKIEGAPTGAEFTKARKYLNSTYNGKPVTVNGKPGVATGKISYGKHQIQLQDGTEEFYKLSEIKSKIPSNQDIYDYLKLEGIKDLEHIESIVSPSKEGGIQHGTGEVIKQPAADREVKGEKRIGVLSEIQERHKRRVGTLRQVVLANRRSPAGIREAAKTEGGLSLFLDGYNNSEFQKASTLAEKYGMEVVPISDQSKSVNGLILNKTIFINMSEGADLEILETVYHEISHAKGNAETQSKIDTESDAFIKYRILYSKYYTSNNDTLLPIEMVLEEYAADLESGAESHYGIRLGDGLKTGTSVQPISETSNEIKATGNIKYSIVRDKGAVILEEGSKKKFKTIFQIASYLSRRVPIDYQTATSAENREVDRKLSDFLETCLKKLPEAKGWYKKDFTRTMQILEGLDPAIKNPENNFRMRLAIAITSNGNKSIPTIETAWDIYRNWSDNRSFMIRLENARQKTIVNTCEKVNQLRSYFKSDLEMESWLMGSDSLRTIKEKVGDLLTLSEGEKLDTEAPRAAAILGPKLGAFFNNLSGNFDPVTMDRWFMRTIGRITGTLTKTSDVDTKRQGLRDVVTDEIISEIWGNELGIFRASELTDDDLDSLAIAIKNGKWRNLKGKYDSARNAGNALADVLKGELQDSPISGGQREWIRERMQKVRQSYPKFDLSDVQAAIWIGEKELYYELGGRKEKADYYSEGAEALARKLGRGELLRRVTGATGRVRPEGRGSKEQEVLFSLRERRLKSGLSRQVFDMIKANPDGFTIDISTGGMVEKGYAVAPTKRTETPLDELTVENVDGFLEGNRDLFDADDRAFFGGWLSQDEQSPNFGKYVLDVSYVVDSYADAVYIGEIGEQDGIYHIEAGQYIPTRDGLKDLKTRGLFKAGKRTELRRIQESMHSIIDRRRPDQARYSVRRPDANKTSGRGVASGSSGRTGTGRSQPVRGRVTGTDPKAWVGVGIHYSQEPRKELDSRFYGTGLADAARLRLPSNTKSPLWQRIYFYYDSPEYGVHPEAGVGSYRHNADLSGLKIYNPYSHQILVERVMGEHVANTYEKAIIKAGYDGYTNPDKGMLVLLGKRKVAVEPVEKANYSLRQTAAEPFYSQLLNTVVSKIKEMPSKIQSIPKWLERNNVKPAEMKWMDVEQWLADNQKDGRIDKQEFADFIRANQIEIKEVTKGASAPDINEDITEFYNTNGYSDNAEKHFGSNISVSGGTISADGFNAEFIGYDNDSNPVYEGDDGYYWTYNTESSDLHQEVDKPSLTGQSGNNKTKFSQYQLPGGENYRELLLTLPVQNKPDNWTTKINKEETEYSGEETLDIVDAVGITRATLPATEVGDYLRHEAESDRNTNKKITYHSAHWDEPNVLAHVRMNDRVDADGNRVLLLEEVQSDWHQEGKKKGYVTSKTKSKIEERDRLQNVWSNYVGRGMQNTAEGLATLEDLRALNKELRETGVPPAPFAENWHELVMKRMLRYAAENGYDKLAWTTGEQQAERYNLSKHIQSINYEPIHNNPDDVMKDRYTEKYFVNNSPQFETREEARSWAEGNPVTSYEYIVYGKDGLQMLHDDEVDIQHIEEIFGKDVAQKMKMDEGARIDSHYRDWRTLSGLDLKVGGEGMKSFYDNLIPGFMNRYVKQWGAKVGKSSIKTEEKGNWKDIDLTTPEGIKKLEMFGKATVHSVPITPAMQESVMQGQPMFSVREKLLSAVEKSAIGTLASTFYKHPEDIPKDVIAGWSNYAKENEGREFSKWDYALNVPFRLSQKYKEWADMWRIHAVDRQEKRSDLRHEFIEAAEDFLMYDQKMKEKGLNRAQIAESQSRINRTLIAGDAIGVEFTEEQLKSGISDKYGKPIQLNNDEISAYISVRNALRIVRSRLIDHLSEQVLRGYQRQKWFRLLESAVGKDINASEIGEILDRKGLDAAALTKARKIQVNVKSLFERLEKGISEVPAAEVANVSKLYTRMSNKMQKDMQLFSDYISEATGIADKSQLTKMSQDIFEAYVRTRPHMKIIRKMRNEVGNLTGYFPRFRSSGNHKLRLFQVDIDPNTGKIAVGDNGIPAKPKEVFMKMFSNKAEFLEAYKEAAIKFGDGKHLNKNIQMEMIPVTTSPEGVFQGVNDVNVQRIFDDAMTAVQQRGGTGIDATYINSSGETINVWDQFREAGFRAIADQFKSRGAMRQTIGRSEDLIEGYYEDELDKVLLNYMSSMAGLMTKQSAAAESMELLSTIKNPSMFTALSRYNREMLRNESVADRISGKTRSFAFTYFLGGLLKSAVINTTQNPIVGFSELGKFMTENGLGGHGKSDIIYAAAMKDVLAGNLTPEEKQFLDDLVSKGHASDQYIQSVFENVTQKHTQKHLAIMKFLAKPFSISEVFNRKSAALAMYRTAYNMRLEQASGSKEEAYAKIFDDARTFINNVHYSYGKPNRPLPIMTGDVMGAAASSLYTFKGFAHNFLARQAELISQGDFRTLGHTLAYLALFGGLSAMPFFKDLFDWWEKEYGWNPMNSIRTSLRGVGGETLEKFGVTGLPSVLGANFSGSLMTGLPWPIGASSPEDSIFGVWGGMLTKAKRAGEALSRGDFGRAITEGAPEFMRAPRVAMRESEIGKQLLGTPGYATNLRGRPILGDDGKPISMSSWEAALKIMGFNPTDYSRAKEKTQSVTRLVAWVNDLKQDVAQTYRVEKINGNPDALKNMMKGVKDVNDKIRSRGLEHLVTPMNVSTVIKSSRQKIGKKERREIRYKQEAL